MTRALAGYESDVDGDTAKFQVEEAARNREQKRPVDGEVWIPEKFEKKEEMDYRLKKKL